MSEQEIKELAEIIKECGEYSVELDGYVVNPATTACKILAAGYRLCVDENGHDLRDLCTKCKQTLREEIIKELPPKEVKK